MALARFKWFFIMGVVPLPWIALRILGVTADPIFIVVLTGLGITASAFILTWAAEAAEHDFAGPLVLLLLALIAVLPEYAVDGTLAWEAGKDISFAPFAVANMTGANRLLVGIGWSVVVFVVFIKMRLGGSVSSVGKVSITLPATQRLDCAILFFATLYAFFIALKGSLNWYDTAVLFAIFGFYFLRVSRITAAKMAVVGPAKAIADITARRKRVGLWVALMAYATCAIFLSAEPFAHGLIDVGKSFNIDEFLLVQWLAPLASEAPEFTIAIIFALRLAAGKGLGILVSSEVNQLTLLIGTLPLLFMISHGGITAFALDGRQTHEIYLTAAQSLFAVTLLANLSLSLKEACLLAGLFLTQFFIPDGSSRMIFTFIYLGLAALNILRAPRASVSTWKAVCSSLYRTPSIHKT